MTVNKEQVRTAVESLLIALGEDPFREGLRDTPRRVADMWEDWLSYKPGHMTTFNSLTTDQMVIVRHIDTWSFCEHHLLPFQCDVSIGYISTGSKVLGISKLARIAQKYSHALQMQERLAEQIADGVAEAAHTKNVAVYIVGQHTCMTMRGARANGAETITSVMRGFFRSKPAARAEFFAAVKP